MPLQRLTLHFTEVSDVSPLRGLPLHELGISGSAATDIEPLRGLKLKSFTGDRAPIRNPNVLAGMPLEAIVLDVNYYRDASWLRDSKTLKQVNGAPVADFWAKVDARQREFDAWCDKVAKLPGTEQVRAVLRELKKRNPEFDEKTRDEPGIVKDQVVSFSIWTMKVNDIEPVRALKHLKALGLTGDSDAAGKVVNLWPLRELQLDYLHIGGNGRVDLTGLKGLRLRELAAGYLNIADLRAFDGIDIASLGLQATQPFADLSPLKGRKLKSLHLRITLVKDIEPLRGMPLEYLYLPAGVTDLEPIRGMPLKELHCGFKPWRDAEILRALKSLESINDKPAQAFWKEVDAERARVDGWVEQARRVPPEERFKEVRAKMLQLNPKLGEKWNARYTMKNGVIDDYIFQGDFYSELWPLRAFPEMPSLRLGRGEALPFDNRATLTDLWPLRGLKIGHLSLHNTEVSDLRPLEGMPLESIRLTGTRVADLSPLLKTPLKHIECDYVPVRDAPILRRIKTLQTINGKNAEDALR
jgi:hypothetical protein